MNWKVMEDPAMMGPVVVPTGSDSKAVRDKAILPEAVGHELEQKPKIPLSCVEFCCHRSQNSGCAGSQNTKIQWDLYL